MAQQLGLGMEEQGARGLSAVYATFERSEPYSGALFEGFTSLRVLTY